MNISKLKSALRDFQNLYDKGSPAEMKLKEAKFKLRNAYDTALAKGKTFCEHKHGV
jgi:hypothetical protein